MTAGSQETEPGPREADLLRSSAAEEVDPIVEQYLRRLRSRRRQRWGVQLISLVIVLGGWQLIGSQMNPLFLPTPVAVLAAGVDLWANGEMADAFLVSVRALAVGFVAATFVGISIGLLMGQNRLVEAGLDPYVNAAYVTPRVALIPLIVIWIGFDVTAQMVVIFLASIFPILINTYAGVRSISGDLLDLAASFRADRRQVFWHFVLPGSVPFIMAGVRLGGASAVVGLVVAQMFLALAGLGNLLVSYGNLFRTAYVLAVVVHIGILGMTVAAATKWLERRTAYWKETERAFV